MFDRLGAGTVGSSTRTLSETIPNPHHAGRVYRGVDLILYSRLVMESRADKCPQRSRGRSLDGVRRFGWIVAADRDDVDPIEQSVRRRRIGRGAYR
jgi:hypothetical protein